MATALRPRSAPELLDAVVVVLRRHYFELLTVAVLAAGFTAVGLVLVSALTTRLRVPSGVGLSLLAAFAVVSIAVQQATVTVIAAEAYCGHPVSIAAALRRALDRFWPAVAVTVIRLLAIVAGLVLFVVPGVLCGLWFFASMNVLMVEGRGPIDALRRSRELAKGSLTRVFGVLAACLCGVLVFRFIVVQLLVMLMPGVHARSPTTGTVSNSVGFLVYPLMVVTTTLLYFDLRIRKEGFDIAHLAAEIDANGAVQQRKVESGKWTVDKG